LKQLNFAKAKNIHELGPAIKYKKLKFGFFQGNSANLNIQKNTENEEDTI